MANVSFEPTYKSVMGLMGDVSPLYNFRPRAINPFFPPIQAVEKLSRPKAELPKGWPVSLGPPIINLATVDHGTIPREACERKSSLPWAGGELFFALLEQPPLSVILPTN